MISYYSSLGDGKSQAVYSLLNAELSCMTTSNLRKLEKQQLIILDIYN